MAEQQNKFPEPSPIHFREFWTSELPASGIHHMQWPLHVDITWRCGHVTDELSGGAAETEHMQKIGNLFDCIGCWVDRMIENKIGEERGRRTETGILRMLENHGL